ncbi:MAG: RNA 2',3'-cyclic phosphodiesterase [Corallococcus sp.]|nr:RNA 2',3'-cyclic phosphodiesterase [Corallococcus sp.]
MRLFIALDLPEKAKDNLARQSLRLKDFATRGRFTPKENLHVTLHFLGETEESNLVYVYRAMDKAAVIAPVEMSVTQIASWRSAGIVCAKYKYHGIDELHAAIGDELENYGFSVEHRAYRPHTTLMREYAFDMPFAEVTKNVPVYNMPFVADTVTLYKSEFAKNGVQYTPLYSVKLLGKSDR